VVTIDAIPNVRKSHVDENEERSEMNYRENYGIEIDSQAERFADNRELRDDRLVPKGHTNRTRRRERKTDRVSECE